MNLNTAMGAERAPNGSAVERSESNLNTCALYTPHTPQRMGAPLVLRAHTAETEWERMGANGSRSSTP